MRRLILLRHAKSDWSQPGMGDHERALNRRGLDAAPAIGAYLAEAELLPDLVICSTAQRTRETFALVAAELPEAPKVRFDERLYLAERPMIFTLIRAMPRTVDCAMLIGHNPGMHEAAVALVGSGDLEQLDRLRRKLPTAGLAVIDFAATDWPGIRARRGRLERFVTPRQLADGD